MLLGDRKVIVEGGVGGEGIGVWKVEDEERYEVEGCGEWWIVWRRGGVVYKR